MKTTILISLATIAFGVVFAHCTKDNKPCSTYDVGIKPIIDQTCAYAGCHSGVTASNYVPNGAKDFTNYANLFPSLENGKFENRALELKNMPNSTYVKEGHPKVLTPEELSLLNCWKDAGFPEK